MTSPAPSGFMVFHSNRMEGLRELLLSYVKERPLSPLQSEILLVQSNGMKHWLTLSLANTSALGICAATRLELPSSQLWQIYRSVLGADKLPAHMALDKAPMVWRILRRLPEWLKDPCFSPLAHYLGDDTQGSRAFGLAQQLADVLDGYQNYRADWLEHWAAGRDVLDRGQTLALAQAWQAAMWRDLLGDVQAHLPEAQTGFQARSDVHKAFMQALKILSPQQLRVVLPPRLLVFGITALPMQTLEALVALGRFIPVLMFVHNPSREHWGHLTESLIPEGHPLLAAWGKHGRDYLHAIDNFEAADPNAAPFERVNLFIDPLNEARDAGQPASVLQALQSAILHLDTPPTAPALLGQPDHSLQFVQTHSAQREVEVLHDRILAWLDADPQLQPSDIMVMVPDMAAFAPHIHAVFSRFQQQAHTTGSRHLPYAVADTTAQQEPTVQALQTLLQLPQLRWSLSEWLGLFQVEMVQNRYGLQAQDVQDLHQLLSDAGVRWGLDGQHRQHWGVQANIPHHAHNTWVFGLQRLLLGYALGDTDNAHATWQDTFSQTGVDGLDAPVVSALLRSLQDVQLSLQQLSQDHTPSQWVQLLQALVARFFKVGGDADQRLLDRILTPLEQWLNDCQLAQFDSPVALAVVRSHWLAQMDAGGLQRRFMGGGVQFATLMPMRAIPFKVVCLLGMNDGAYPRSPAPRDFDLMSHPSLGRAGDRARREDDRYLFLEAVLSARERLYVSWQGRRASDHAKLPPSVLVAQLLDHLNLCYALPKPTADDDDATTQPAFEAPLQPLQPFSSKYFVQGSGFLTYAADWQATRSTLPPSDGQTSRSQSAAPLNRLTEQDLGLLLRHPEEVHFRASLQVRLDKPPQASEEDEPFDTAGLQRFVMDQSVLYSEEPAAQLMQLQRQGMLALSGFGQLQQDQMQELRETVLGHMAPWLQEPGQDLPAQAYLFQAHGIDVQSGFGGNAHAWRQLPNGTAAQIDLRPGKVLNSAGQARLYTLAPLWLGHLSANAAGVQTTTLQSGEDGLVALSPLPASNAQALLADLVTVYLQAWQRPLPLACISACAWLMATHFPTGKTKPEEIATKAVSAARQAFEGGFRQQGERATSPSLQRAFPEFEDLWTELPVWAERVYGPMLQALMPLTSKAASPVAAVPNNEVDA
ncbi:MAG: exodeoxyribonuclease V subunit gamma [Burkholderiaceae bacterium]|nr:exodeoxyribonuclease V subunit gamma [Burkholderiaceae bacterium]